MLLDLIKTNSWNTGQFFMVFRIAIAGSPITPPIVDCLPILGKEKTINRLQNAFAKLFV
jgi:glutamyl/glutaminyl-tRNA synthetase